jgi:hypothetical protein
MDQRGTIEERIEEWRRYLRRHEMIQSDEVDELEDHLRTQIDALSETGLEYDEAFLVAVKRMGELDLLSREFAREYSERLWKQLVVSTGKKEFSSLARLDAIVAVGLAVAAALAFRLPEIFGLHLGGSEPASSFYFNNLSLFALPFLAVYFGWKREFEAQSWMKLATPFLVALLVINLMPFKKGGDTEILASLHLPIALWFSVGYSYVSGRWKSHDQRMNFVRFSGEWFIYYALIALGGGVLIMFTIFIFESIDLDSEPVVQTWIIPAGAMGAVLISAWLVEAKKSLIENMAPVLTRLFTPMFTLLLLIFLATMVVTGKGIYVERDVLIGFDLLLVLVLALLLYSISARDSEAPANIFDIVQFVLVVSMLLVDGLALLAIAARISEFGFSANKVAALGENLILLVNLGWSAVLYARFLTGRTSFTSLEHWQMTYIPVYVIWAWVVVVLFPFLFRMG